MSRDVKQVTDVARDVADIGKRAREVGEHLKDSVAQVGDALDVAEDLSKALRSAAAELRGVLGQQTNAPPKEDGGTEEAEE